MIARVTLEIALGKDFDYRIPEHLQGRVEIGSRVKVPFGPRHLMACVTALPESSPHPRLKDIIDVVGATALVTPEVMKLARWIADYYCCPVETALKSVLPDAVRREEAGWRERLYVRALPVQGPMPELTDRQTEVWNIIEEWRELPLQELVELAATTAGTIRKLEDKGLITVGPQISERDPYAREHILPTQPIELNPGQAAALGQITSALDGLRGSLEPPVDTLPASPVRVKRVSTFLLHGVTGSGKTEVYLQAIAHALAQGGGAIVLVPEISLTPQTVERFKARFCSGTIQTLVAVLHSHLSAGERHDEWHKIRQGRARIVIGARSAVFAPIQRLALVIVDEEHEPSYKQEEAPRYHARDMAIVRAQMAGAVAVLGSATPSLESYHHALSGKYRLLELTVRVDDQRMPVVRIVNMCQERRGDKGPPIFSLRLREAILQRLERREQVILFLNRRGYASSLQCSRCGYVAECINCSISLTYHRRLDRLCCHICGYERPVPAVCPKEDCRNPAIRFSGLGTEKVEDALIKSFPQAAIRRMDSDTLKRKEDYRRVLGEFRIGKVDILVGTQMIAKGLHFPNVTLVGIVLADMGLHQPDFRAGERTFQLLTQVAGRAGRGDIEGEVIVQTFTPFHASIQYARQHDFIGFYEQEIEFRKQLHYPPLSRIALLLIRGRNDEKVRVCANHIRSELDKGVAGLPDLHIAGPAPAPLLRAEGYYRYHLMVRTSRMRPLGRVLGELGRRLSLPDDILLTIDIDPVSIM